MPYKRFKQHRLESIRPSDEELKEIFNDIAVLQRGEPETAMRRYQRASGGGVMDAAVEHIGDIIHRMTEQVMFRNAGYVAVRDKVRKALRWLKDEYGFEKEFLENLESNARMTDQSPELFKRKMFNLLDAYAEEHNKLPVYNTAQFYAQLAAVSLGHREFDICIMALEWLFERMDSPEQWKAIAHEYDPDQYQ